jgi:hypothetical protein
MNKPTLRLPDHAGAYPALVLDGSISALWKDGYDTKEIARLINVRESVVYNRIISMRKFAALEESSS